MEGDSSMEPTRECRSSSLLDETRPSQALLGPEISFDDSVSGTSGMDVSERLSSLEQRVQAQEDELQMLKGALADLLRRLSLSEEKQTPVGKKGPAKAKPATRARSVGSLAKSSTVPPKKTSPAPTPSCSRRTPAAPAAKKGGSPECTGAQTHKEGSISIVSTGTSLSRQKESALAAGTRRVAHCKVTMQIYLSRPQKRTGSSEARLLLMSLPVRPTSAPPKVKSPPDKVKAPNLTLSLRKISSQTAFPPLDTPGYKSPVKSPSQYFQICY